MCWAQTEAARTSTEVKGESARSPIGLRYLEDCVPISPNAVYRPQPPCFGPGGVFPLLSIALPDARHVDYLWSISQRDREYPGRRAGVQHAHVVRIESQRCNGQRG